MPSNADIPSHFYYHPMTHDATITFLIQSKDKVMVRELMRSICFDTKNYEFQGAVPEENTCDIKRIVYVIKKENYIIPDNK